MRKIMSFFIMFFSLFLIASCKESESNALTYQEYLAAPRSTTVTIDAYIQAKQSWWENDGVGVASFYLQDYDGGYFVYNLPCTEDDYDKVLTKGTRIMVTGQKTDWAGEIEIDGLAAGAEATYEVLEGTYVAEPKNVSSALGTEKLINSMNMLVEFKNLYVLPQADGKSAFYYKWDNSGAEGDDLYFNLSDGKNTLSACVESYLCDKNSDVYKAVTSLSIGDKVSIEGFLYWYDTAQPHTTKLTKTGNIFTKSSGTNTHQQYVNTETGKEVTIEAYIQGKQSWWEDNGVGVASFYLQDQNGGYFAYKLPCTKEDYDKKLNVGVKLRIKGLKTSWAGEHEIDGQAAGAEATYEIINDLLYVASAKDVTLLLGKDTLENYQNMFGKFSNLMVVAKDEKNVIYYKYNNTGNRGDDIYFDVKYENKIYTFTVESDLCDKDSECYKMVETLKAGDVISVEGFLYWYNGIQPHVTKITKG